MVKFSWLVHEPAAGPSATCAMQRFYMTINFFTMIPALTWKTALWEAPLITLFVSLQMFGACSWGDSLGFVLGTHLGFSSETDCRGVTFILHSQIPSPWFTIHFIHTSTIFLFQRLAHLSQRWQTTLQVLQLSCVARIMFFFQNLIYRTDDLHLYRNVYFP